MSVNQVSMWIVRCDACGRDKPTGPAGGPEMFYSYDSAVSLAKLDGYRFNHDHRVTCPSCSTTEKS